MVSGFVVKVTLPSVKLAGPVRGDACTAATLELPPVGGGVGLLSLLSHEAIKSEPDNNAKPNVVSNGFFMK